MVNSPVDDAGITAAGKIPVLSFQGEERPQVSTRAEKNEKSSDNFHAMQVRRK
jgi:hypothetical protein